MHHQQKCICFTWYSETLQLPFIHFRFISHRYLELKASCRRFALLLQIYVRLCDFFPRLIPIFLKAVHIFPNVWHRLSETTPMMVRKFYTKLFLGLSREKRSSLNCPHLHILTWEDFPHMLPGGYLSWHQQRLTLGIKKCVRVCVWGKFFLLLWKCHRDLPRCISLEQYCILKYRWKVLKAVGSQHTDIMTLIIAQMENYPIKWLKGPCWWSNNCNFQQSLAVNSSV